MSFWDDLMGGGGGKWNVKQQIADNEKRREFIEQQIAQGRSDLTSGYGMGMGIRNQGAQQALDIYGQTIPQQFDTFQQGNLGAQQTLLAGLPQYQNAIMGLPVDMSGFSPQAIDYNTDWAQQYIPGYNPALLGGGGNFSQPSASVPEAPPIVLGDQAVIGNEGNIQGIQGYGPAYSAPELGRNSSNIGYIPTGNSFSNPFADTYNATDMEKLFGNKDIGSLAQLKLSEQGGNIGKAVGALTGIPGLGFLGNWLGNRNIGNKTWMSPTNPDAPYESDSDVARALAGLFNPDANLPNSPANPNAGGIGAINTPYSTNSAYRTMNAGTTGGSNGGTRLKYWPKEDQD